MEDPNTLRKRGTLYLSWTWCFVPAGRRLHFIYTFLFFLFLLITQTIFFFIRVNNWYWEWYIHLDEFSFRYFVHRINIYNSTVYIKMSKRAPGDFYPPDSPSAKAPGLTKNEAPRRWFLSYCRPVADWESRMQSFTTLAFVQLQQMIPYFTLKILCYIWFDKSGYRFIQNPREPGATFEKK